MPDISFENWTSFFIHRAEFIDGGLAVSVGDGNRIKGVVQFSRVFAFIKFDESEFYDVMKIYRTENICSGPDRDVGVFEVTQNALLASADKIHWKSTPRFFLISSPQECIEVAAHDPPLFHLI
jgi:hypothetical protein